MILAWNIEINEKFIIKYKRSSLTFWRRGYHIKANWHIYTQQACFAFDFMKNYFIVRQFLIMTNYIHNFGCCFFESHSPSVPSWLSLFWTPHSPYEPSSPSVGWSAVVIAFFKGSLFHRLTCLPGKFLCNGWPANQILAAGGTAGHLTYSVCPLIFAWSL